MAEVFLFCLLLLLSIPTVFLCLEVAAAVLCRGKVKAQKDGGPCGPDEDISVVVLIPAHNEEMVIGATLDQVSEQLQNRYRLLVVADNCSDETASIARNNNAEVIERHDEQKRGKGYALDCGIQFLKCNPPDVVVILDADIRVAPGTIRTISRLAYQCKRPVQAKNLLNLPDNAAYKTSISAFAFLFKNYIRPMGLAHLGGGCLLMGTGMAFAWDIMARAHLANENIVEDMQLGIDLAIEGATPTYCQDALVTSDMPPTENAALTQRTRWEHGYFMTLFTQAGRLLRQAVKQRRLDLALLVLEIAVPPLASLALLLGASFLLSMTFYFCGIIPDVFPILFGVLIFLLLLSTLSGWSFFGRNIVSCRQAFMIPLYVIWKIPIYISLFFRRERRWTKTERKDLKP